MTTENALHIAAARAKNLSLLMTRWPSVTGSPDEAAFSERLREHLAETPYFRNHPDQLITVDSHGEPMTQNVVALVRGRGRRTVVLAGHFDTVSIANYGTLAPLACDPEPLTEALLQELRSRPLNGAETKALMDFESGDFIAGRGLLDMKSGLAAGIAALERFTGLEAPEGNILFVATPDEENRSRGMRSLRNALPEIARRFGLDIVGGINLDASSCERDGEEGRAVYLGSIGKFAPFAFVIGRPTHAGYPFNGTSAHRISAEIVRAMDTVPELSDDAFGERSPPPVCLEARDIRDGYDVTTPDRVWLSFNWLTHRRSPADILGEFRTPDRRAERCAGNTGCPSGALSRPAGSEDRRHRSDLRGVAGAFEDARWRCARPSRRAGPITVRRHRPSKSQPGDRGGGRDRSGHRRPCRHHRLWQPALPAGPSGARRRNRHSDTEPAGDGHARRRQAARHVDQV